VRNRVRWSHPLFEPTGPSEAEILARLSLIVAGREATTHPSVVFEEMEQQLILAAINGDARLKGRTPADLTSLLEARDPLDRLIEIMIRGGAYGDAFGVEPEGLTFAKLRENPHGIDLGPLEPALPDLLRTPSGRIELMPDSIRDELARLTATLDAEATFPEFVLIGRRDQRSNNSWMHNLPVLIKGKARCTLQIHPEDAGRLGLENGRLVRVQSRVGQVVAPAELTDKVMLGVVSLPHGYGHDRPGTTQRVAAAHAGVNINLLTDSKSLDPLSGNAVLNGIPVALEAVG
jgi:anaerobic selenocysteine-containing dehydrogenase